MIDRRVAITGLGVVTPIGIGIESFWEALLAGQSGVSRITRFDPSKFRCAAGAELHDFSAREFVPKHYRKAVKVMARDIEIAVAAADLGFRDSGIVTRGIDADNTTIDPKRLACNIGAGLICTDLNELGAAINTAVADGKFDLKLWGSSGMSNLTPLWLLKYLPNMLSCHVTIIHGAEGPSNCITCGDASGHLAVGEAGRYIARGASDAAVAGGAEGKLNPMGLIRQLLLGRVCANGDSGIPRPFDENHNGTVVGEGGGVLILEDMTRAESRGARIYAELVGFGAACDPGGIDVMGPTAGSLDLAVRRALADADITCDQVDLIVAHGTGVPGEDACEVEGWKGALGGRAEEIPVVAITGAIGSLFAGTGGVELSVGAMGLHTQTVPATVNYTGGDAGGLNVTTRSIETELEYAVSGAFTVGGQSAACVLKRYRK